MISSQEEDEFVAVRVQDPRVQNEGSWNSYVDYKIFLHTNSKAFTAKTSCVRRRYSEFAWLKKKLQKNSGLVPVPDLPGKSLFFFSDEDFLESRRKGLQVFLDKVVHMTVCLSDSQLHLFLQTQLPVGHIQDCVQGHTPYSVTDAILTYASSNRGFAQAQQEDESMKEHSLTVSYESMESPLPHQPGPPTGEPSKPETDLPEGQEQLSNDDTEDQERGENSLMKVIQKDNHLAAIVEDGDQPRGVIFFLGDGQEDGESRSHLIQTPVDVHCGVETAFQVDNGQDGESDEVASVRGRIDVTSDTVEEQTGGHPDSDGQRSPQEAHLDVDLCVDSVAVLDAEGNHAENSQHALQDVCSEVPENQGVVSSPEDIRDVEEQMEPEDEERMKSESRETPAHDHVQIAPRVEGSSDTDVQPGQEQAEPEVDSVGSKGESDEEGGSLHSSNESIMKVTDEESMCDEAEESMREELGFEKSSSKEEPLWSEGPSILDLHINGYPEERDGDVAEGAELSDSQDVNSTVKAADLTENSDFSILEASDSPGLSDTKYMEEEGPLPADCAEVEAC
ncbi:sorting nexin-11 [Nelusetta ayraudi]|uniref:sorting nexin-11 n=1 Tax=Nelusetta ayraudi TaxID=303726 RepID=UPI003F72147C